MDSNAAIRDGGLTNNSTFFGTSTSEIVSRATSGGGWNGDLNDAVYSGRPWAMNGGRPEDAAGDGIFAFFASSTFGGSNHHASNRTILLGY